MAARKPDPLDNIDRRDGSFCLVFNGGEYTMKLSDRSGNFVRLRMSENQVLMLMGEAYRAYVEGRRYGDREGGSTGTESD